MAPRRHHRFLLLKDTWEWNIEAECCYEEVVECGGRTAETMLAFRTLLGNSDMMAYLAMMAPRLVELRRILRDTGSIYLHCDPTASHYLKLLMDGVFGPTSYRNEITWKRTATHNDPNQYGRNTDIILFYTKSENGHGTQSVYLMTMNTSPASNTKKAMAGYSTMRT